MLTTSMFGLHRLRGKVNESSLSTSANTNHHPTSSSASASGDSLSSVQYCNGCTCASHRDCSCSSGAISGADRPSEAASHVSLERSPPSALTSAFRWSLEYDLCVCHSAKDDQEAECLVSYLEATVRSLRCFLPPRDSSLGSPMSTELHRAVQSSHCWVLLITSHFLQDDWCLYLMHQALSEAPMSNRIIPTVLHLPYSECPKELRFYYIIDLSQKANQHHGYDRVYKAVLNYLEDSLEKDTNKAIASTATISDAEIDDFSSLKEMDANMYHTSTKVKQRLVAKLPNACNVM